MITAALIENELFTINGSFVTSDSLSISEPSSQPPHPLQNYRITTVLLCKFKGTVLKDSTVQVSRGEGMEMKMKEEPMLQLKKSSSSTDKVFPVCICVDCDMNGDVSLLTYSTKTENERCDTGGERIQ